MNKTPTTENLLAEAETLISRVRDEQERPMTRRRAVDLLAMLTKLDAVLTHYEGNTPTVQSNGVWTLTRANLAELLEEFHKNWVEPVMRDLEIQWARDGKRIQDAAIAAAKAQDLPGMQAALREAKGINGWQDRYATNLGHRTSDRHKEVQAAFEALIADIQRAINGELPDQWGEDKTGDEWKDKK
jgi:hypothetical protein